MEEDRNRQNTRNTETPSRRLGDTDPVGDAPSGDRPEYSTDTTLSGNTPEAGADQGALDDKEGGNQDRLKNTSGS